MKNIVIVEKQLKLELEKNIEDLKLIDFMVLISFFISFLHITSPIFRKKHYISIDECPYKNDNYFDEVVKRIELLYKKENKKFNYEIFENYISKNFESSKKNNINWLFSLGFSRNLLQRSFIKVEKEINEFSNNFIIYKLENNETFYAAVKELN